MRYVYPGCYLNHSYITQSADPVLPLAPNEN